MTLWTRLAARRFGGCVQTRAFSPESETGSTASLTILTCPRLAANNGGLVYGITVRQSTSNTSPGAMTTEFHDVLTTFLSQTEFSATIAGALKRATTIPQTQVQGRPGRRATPYFQWRAYSNGPAPTPGMNGSEGSSRRRRAFGSGTGALRAPMPSLVVEVLVAVGERVEKRQVIVVLESLKTETVLGAPVDGIVKAFGCPKSEVEESRSWWGLKRTKAIAGVANNVVLYSHPA